MKKVPLKRVPFKAKKTGLKKKPFNKNSAGKTSKKPLKNNKQTKFVKRKPIRRESRTELAREIKACDVSFSQMIRLSNADKNGIVNCYTCNYRGFYKQDSVECGHFRGRTNMTTRWMRLNVAPQCTRCNQLKSGNLAVFKKNLIRDHGPEIINYLDRQSKKISKLTLDRVRALREYFESQVVLLKSKLK